MEMVRKAGKEPHPRVPEGGSSSLLWLESLTFPDISQFPSFREGQPGSLPPRPPM